MPEPDFTIKRNDTWPPLQATLKDQDGAIDLTEAEAIHIYLKKEEGGLRLVKTKPVEVLNALRGEVRYEWEIGDTSVSGLYKLEFEIIWEPGKEQTVPSKEYRYLLIVDDLGQPSELV